MSQSDEEEDTDQPTNESVSEGIHQRIKDIKQAIWKRRPILGEIVNKHGQKTLHNYSIDFIDINSTPRLDERKAELIETARELIETRLGKDIADGVAKQLYKKPLVSTIDHHGPIDHPFFVNSNIISAFPFSDLQDTDLRYWPVFSFASVSVNNPSAYPRGILFHGDHPEKSHEIIRLPVIADKYKMSVVYNMHPFTTEDLERSYKQLSDKVKSGDVSPARSEKIKNVLETFFGDPEVLASPDLSTQIMKINFKMWPKLFHGPNGTANKGFNYDLIYLDIETLMSEILLKYHLNNKDSLLYRILFDKQIRPLVLKHFNNLPGGFSQGKNPGSFFFWATDEKMHRVGLTLKDDDLLYCDSNQEHLAMTPESIIENLKNKKIFPNMMLCYLMTSLYYGMKCLGGFCQVHDLTVIKQAWQAFLQELGEQNEVEAIEPVQTKEFGGCGVVIAYHKTQKGNLVPATGIDMLISEEDTSFERYMNLAKQVGLEEMMDTMLPEMYSVFYHSEERENKFMTLSPEDILYHTGVEQKLKDFLDEK